MARQIRIDTSELKALERQFGRFKLDALPVAIRDTLNKTAFVTQTRARENAAKELTLRNTFTRRSIRVNKASGDVISQQESATGSTEDYMRRQELGGLQKPRKQSKNVAIVTGFAAGQEGIRPRTKLAKPSNRPRNIRLRKRRTAGIPRKQRIFMQIRDAVINKDRHVFLDLGRVKGIFRVVGGRRNNTSAARIKMVSDLTRKVTRTDKRPWLRPAADLARTQMPRWYGKELRKQLQRLGLFRD